MRRPLSLTAALLALCLMAPSPRALAQGAPTLAQGAPTLAQALAQAEAPRDTVYLAVAAEKVTPPKDSALPPPGAAIPQVADAYGQITQAWETAAAVAPPTMTLLNTDPGTPDPYDGMPPGVALKLLLGGLDDGEWRALTGDQGLGYDALTDPSQQQLFTAIFPGGTLTAQPQGDPDPQHGVKLTTDDLQQARLRLSQQVDIMLPVAGSPGTHIGNGTDFDDGKTRYTASQVFTVLTGDIVYGVQVRAAVPNALKPSDLDAADLTATVPLAGVKTVGELIGRIGAATKTELYADVRYEARTVAAVGPPSARAGDLLRALALCVCGTYRRVGPAYVLTDDVAGYGTRQMVLSRFARAADMARAGALADAGDKLFARGGVLGLPPTAPGLGVTEAERASQDATSAGGLLDGSQYLQVPFNKLTPQQQGAARREFQKSQEQQQSNSTVGLATMDGTFMLQPQPAVQLLSPAVPSPVTLGYLGGGLGLNSGLFRPSAKLQQQMMGAADQEWLQKHMAGDAAKNPRPAPPPPSPAALLAPLPRRAVLARPRTAKDVDALVASMRRIGLNQLWLDVFSEGKSHLAGGGTPNILTEALAKTKGTGIAVIPTLDLLAWGRDAPEDAADRTVLGETSAEAADDQRHYQEVTDQLAWEVFPPVMTLSACPAAPVVVDTLTTLVRHLAATPGVAALALQDTVTPSYAHQDGGGYGSFGGGDLGYTVPLRLACLRWAHVDPVDFEFQVGLPAPASSSASLPDFGADFWPMSQEAQTAIKQWDAVRAEADLALMRRLLVAAQASAGRPFPFLVKQRGQQNWTADWWGLWADPRAPLPALTQQAIQTWNASNDFAPFAHTQSRVAVFALPAVAPQGLVSALQQMKPGWDGVVVDAISTEAGDPLAALAKSLTPAPAKRADP